MLPRSPLLIAIFALAAITVLAQREPGVDVRLSLGEGRTSFRSGERITLILTFSSESGAGSVSTGQSVIDTVLDEVLVSPSDWAFEWERQYMRGALYTSDAIHLKNLSEGPARVELPLNHFVRFDAPGRYTVRVRTKRVWRGLSGPEGEVTTNDVAFDVRMMTESEGAAEVARLSAALDNAKGWQEQTEYVTQLSYLGGDGAVPEKVKRFLVPVESGNYHGAAYFGLLISRNRPLVIKLFEEVFRDLERPVNFQLVGVLVKLRLLEEAQIPAKPAIWTSSIFEADPEELRIRDRYMKEVFDSFPKRRGEGLREAVFLVLQNLPQANPPADALAKVREILIAQFDDLTLLGQEILLSTYWDKIRDPRLVPSLEKILKSGTLPDSARGIMRGHALRRLGELDPERVRPYLIAEIRDPASMMTNDTIEALVSGPLPEVDDALVQQISRFGFAEAASGRDAVWLRMRGMLAVRFATKAAYEPLLQLYRANAGGWQRDSRAFLIAYFLRHEPEEGLRILEAEIEKMHKDQVSMFLHDVTRLHYAAELTPLLEERLASDDARVATSGAYILSMHGPASSRSKIEARLARWVQRWRGRESELEGAGMKPENQGEAMLQVELILALRSGKNWKLTDAELNALIAECKTQLCDQNFRPRAVDPTQ